MKPSVAAPAPKAATEGKFAAKLYVLF